MRVTLTGRQLDVTPSLEGLVTKRLAKIERRLNTAAVSAQVVLTREKNRCVVELTVHARQDHILHALGTSSSWGPALTAAVQKVVQQGDRVKGKWQVRKRSASSARKMGLV
jgi:ribosomal subunit interface protein